MSTVCLLCMTALSFCVLVLCHPAQPKDTMQTHITTDDQKPQYTENKIRNSTKFGHEKVKAIYQHSKGAILLRKGGKYCFSLRDNNLSMCNKQPRSSGNNHETNTHLRHIRSQHVDPSDPLGSENSRSRSINYRRQNREQERERERSGNVSKETIASFDDPLHVLLSKSPVSPNLQKEKRKKQVAPSELY